MRFVVGGEAFDLTRDRVIAAMRGVTGEPIQKHMVEVEGEVFPPKQVFAVVTGRTRTSFTTMEAQRVLRRLGFPCRPWDLTKPASQGAVADGDRAEANVLSRLAAAEASLSTLEAAVAGLLVRIKDLEAAR